MQVIVPVFASEGQTLPRVCGFHKERDPYWEQEDNTIQESANRWTCGFCGKTFIAEYYLDLHYDNRHQQYVRQVPDTVCLAEYCDIFRCDVYPGIVSVDFWDTVLCLEDDMAELQQTCQEVVSSCIPEGLPEETVYWMKERIFNATCSYLTCKSYWHTDEKLSGLRIFLQVFVNMAVFSMMILYYILAYQHFYCQFPSDENKQTWQLEQITHGHRINPERTRMYRPYEP
ncbi:hypothetical protein ACJMK2_009924 [Sinanodonta woodiana]|uniref:C2H2-type domain-containing protein n=1 Tax=Sinanodonta woodiana TaxID=1069815 RepID=A0ABD3VDT8_SINWO